MEADKEFLYQTHTIIATGVDRANSYKLSHADECCGTLIGLAVPSKALMVWFWRQRRRWLLERGQGLNSATDYREGKSVGILLSVMYSVRY